MNKRVHLLLGLLLMTTMIWGQQIDVSGLYAGSTTKMFKNNWGYDLGYNHFIGNSRIGISFRQYFFNSMYDDIYTSSDDGVSIYIEEHDAKNKRMAINLIYSYRLIENENSSLYLGCSAGLNYYQLKGSYTRIANGDLSGGIFKYDYNKNNRLGLGLLIEYELKQIISDRFSTSIKINPELTAFDEFLTRGGYSPWGIGWLNFSIVLKYKLSDKI